MDHQKCKKEKENRGQVAVVMGNQWIHFKGKKCQQFLVWQLFLSHLSPTPRQYRITQPVEEDAITGNLQKLVEINNPVASALRKCSAGASCSAAGCMPKVFHVCRPKTYVTYPKMITSMNSNGQEVTYLVGQSSDFRQPVINTECCSSATTPYPFSCITVCTVFIWLFFNKL
jgi:hypothetical protein